MFISNIRRTMLVLCDMSHIQDKGEWVKLQKSQKINGYLRIGDSIYGGDIDFNSLNFIEPLEGVDAESFEVCKNSDYARDKYHVYYPILEIYREAETWSASRYEKYVVDGASPKSFKYIGDCYGVDGYTMYRMGEKIKWDDAVVNHYQNHEHVTDTACSLCNMEIQLNRLKNILEDSL